MRSGLRGAMVMALLAAFLAAVPADAAKNPSPQLTISVLSGRADLVSGGSALAEIGLPAGAEPRQLTVTLNGQDVSSSFARRTDGRFSGLVTGLALGPNQLSARLPGATGAQITL